MFRYNIISWTAVVLWMILIFYLSHQPATQSNELSKGVTEIIIEIIEKVAPVVAPVSTFDVRDLNSFVRKYTHFIAYLVLGIMVINALRASSFKGFRSLLLALGICIIYAISDEFHQSFIPGRSGEVRDVLIDTAVASVRMSMNF